MIIQCRKCGEEFNTWYPELVKICGHCLGVDQEDYRDDYDDEEEEK
jgi:predicted  nucleic acid-binding Zn-ribbon protein